MSETILKFFQRTEARLCCFGLSAVVAVYLGFLGLSVAQAKVFIMALGYYVLLLTFVLWGRALYQLWRERRLAWSPWTRRELVIAGLLVATLTFVSISQETFRSKILNDEFVLQSTAFNMHFSRETAAVARGYDILGTFVCTDTFVDKRPNFYPFLVCLVHDLTGYRTNNAFYLNAALLPLALCLVYHIGRSLAGWKGGLSAASLLGSLPLFAQNGTGSGMELVNITMLLATVALAAAYLSRPNQISLTAFVLSSILLAQCRYESALYVLPAALVVLVGWWRTNAITLSWPAILVPLLLVPVALHNKVLSHSPILWEMKENQTSRFGLEYVAVNLRSAVEFFFSRADTIANSVVLSATGALGSIWVLWRVGLQWKRLGRLEATRLALLLFGLGILANTALVMFYFWSAFTDPMAARFSLPFYLLLVFAAVIFVARLERRTPATAVLLFATAACFLGLSIPKQARHMYSRVGIDEIEWERRFVASRPPGERLILANNSTIVWLLQKTPSILLNRARLVQDRLRYQLGESTFQEILVLQSLRPTTAEGDHQLFPEERLPPDFHLQSLIEKRFGPKIIRISRLTAIDSPTSVSEPK